MSITAPFKRLFSYTYSSKWHQIELTTLSKPALSYTIAAYGSITNTTG
ncbi:hypothetical protein BN1088_700002 [Sphingobacterium sp. PM2-P1-29]|nr:hypothetical protein BN1088_700002 [Sphingobacterium sp. PM2-P1-29]